MVLPKYSDNEEKRIVTLRAIKILDTKPEEHFDFLVQLATQVFGVPIAAVSLVDTDREWYKACIGLPYRESPRAVSFGNHAILTNSVLVVEDTLKDNRFKDNPYVVGNPYIRFYAGAVIKGPNNIRLGAFCIKDKKPRKFNQKDISVLQGLSKWAELSINANKLSRELLDLKISYWNVFRKLSELEAKTNQ